MQLYTHAAQQQGIMEQYLQLVELSEQFAAGVQKARYRQVGRNGRDVQADI